MIKLLAKVIRGEYFTCYWAAAPALLSGGAAAAGTAAAAAGVGSVLAAGAGSSLLATPLLSSALATSASVGAVTTAAVTGGSALGAAAAGGGFLAGLSKAGSLLSTVSTGLSVVSTLAGGRAEVGNIREDMKAERFNARNREIQRKRDLVRSLALQNVRGGASGVTMGTGSSFQAVMMEDIERADTDQAVDDYGTTARVSQLAQNAKTTTTHSLLSAGAEIAGSINRTARRGAV